MKEVLPVELELQPFSVLERSKGGHRYVHFSGPIFVCEID